MTKITEGIDLVESESERVALVVGDGEVEKFEKWDLAVGLPRGVALRMTLMTTDDVDPYDKRRIERLRNATDANHRHLHGTCDVLQQQQ